MRTIIQVEIENLSPLFIGDEEGSLLLDEGRKEAYLPGTSITGVFRNYLLKIQQEAERLFGDQTKEDSSMSKIYISDAFAPIQRLERRDGVRIDGRTGTAVDGGKIERLYLGEGMVFSLTFEIRSKKEEHDEFKTMIYQCLKALDLQHLRLGGEKSSGLGRFTIRKAEEITFDLTDAEQWQRYLLRDDSRSKNIKKQIDQVEIPQKMIVFRLKGHFTNPVLIKGTHDFQANGPDASFIKSGDTYVIPGSSLKGVIRSRMEKIAHYFDQRGTVESLFGDEKEVEENQLSRFYFHEAKMEVMEQDTLVMYNRIKVDKFTGGVMHGALMNDQPIIGKTEFTIFYRKQESELEDKYAIGLMALALRDLGTENLFIGGGGNIGRGAFQGHFMTIEDGEEQLFIDFIKQEIKGEEELNQYIQEVNNRSLRQ